MKTLLKFIFATIYKLYMRIYIHVYARVHGFKITSFEWLPPNDDNRTVRVTPQDDFEHEGDHCKCIPKKSIETDDAGQEYTLILHRTIYKLPHNG